MKTKLFLCSLLMLVSSFLFGQTSKIDSLKGEIGKQSDDSTKVNLYYELGRQFEYFQSKERISYFIDALKLAKRINYTSGIKKIYFNLITILYHRNINDVAMGYSIEYIEYLEKNNFEEDLLKFCNTYGNILSKQKKYKAARYYYDKAYTYYKSKKDYKQSANVFNNISLLLLNTGELDSCLIYNSLSAQMYKLNKDSSAYANSILGFAEVMIKKEDLEMAGQKANEALEIYKAIKIDLGIANASSVLGEINYMKKEYQLAISNYTTALSFAEKLNFMNIQRDAYLGISKCYEGLKMFEKAYASQLLYGIMNDSIASEDVENKIMEMEVKYDISKKENQLKENEYELMIQSKQKKMLLFVVGSVVILLLFLFYAYRQKRNSNKIISEQKRLVDEKQKEIIDSINYAKRIQRAQLPTEKYIDKTLNRLTKNS